MGETELAVIKKKRHSLRFRICGLLCGGNNVFDKQLIDYRDKLEDIINGTTDFTLLNVFDTIWWTISVIYAIMYNPNDLLDRDIKTKLKIFKLIDWLYRGQLSIRLGLHQIYITYKSKLWMLGTNMISNATRIG